MMATFCVVSCKQQKKESTTVEVVTGIVMSHEDTVMVTNLVTKFMDALRDKRYADAVVMLYKINPQSPYAEPELLGNDEVDQVMTDLKRFPVRNYQIKDYKFNICYDNLVRCTIDTESTDHLSSQLTFALNPVRYLGEWRLCLKK